MKRFSALLLCLVALSGCDSGPGTVLTLLSPEVEVAGVAARCEGGVAQLSVQLVLNGYDPVDILDGDTFVGTAPPESDAADHLLLVTLQVDQDAQPDGVSYNAPLVRPAETTGLAPGARYSLDVPVVLSDGTVTYEQFSVSVPTC